MKTLDNITMDKIIALFWTWIIWRDMTADHLDERGVIKPDDYIPLSKYGAAEAYKKTFFFSCPCCTFMVDHYKGKSSGSFCHGDKCPMKSVWGGKESCACEKNESSPYMEYRHAIIINNMPNNKSYQSAKTISDGARRLYIHWCKHYNITPVDEHFNPLDKDIEKLHQPKIV